MSEHEIERRRFRRAGVMLTEDSSLRDALTDEEANQLLDWGLAQVEAEVMRTLEIADDDAAAFLDDYSGRVRDTMRQVNQLMETLPQADDVVVWEGMLALSQCLHRLRPSNLESRATSREMFNLVQKRQVLGREALFAELLSILLHDNPK